MSEFSTVAQIDLDLIILAERDFKEEPTLENYLRYLRTVEERAGTFSDYAQTMVRVVEQARARCLLLITTRGRAYVEQELREGLSA